MKVMQLWKKDRNTERQKERKIERQKDRKTERQKDRKTERQNDRKKGRKRKNKRWMTRDKWGKSFKSFVSKINVERKKFYNFPVKLFNKVLNTGQVTCITSLELLLFLFLVCFPVKNDLNQWLKGIFLN